MFNGKDLMEFYEKNKNLPHISIYHKESFLDHVTMVVAEMAKKSDKTEMVIAAALHDVAKPRTQGINKRGEPCFYNHEKVTDEDLVPFLSKADSRYDNVKALIQCHMIPYFVTSEQVKKNCEKILGKKVSDEFIQKVILLHEADDTGTIRSEEMLVKVEECRENGRNILLNIV